MSIICLDGSLRKAGVSYLIGSRYFRSDINQIIIYDFEMLLRENKFHEGIYHLQDNKTTDLARNIDKT